MTVAGITAKTRRILADTASPYRWSDAEIREDIQSAVRRLNVIAPRTRYTAAGALLDFVELPVGATAEIGIDGRYEEALALYAAHLCYFNDATDTVNAERSATCLARAEGLMAQ